MVFKLFINELETALEVAVAPENSEKKSRGRPKGSSIEKRTAIIDAAQVLFRSYGFKKTSIDEICQKAGVSRMTFYKHFSEKIELALVVTQRVRVKFNNIFIDIMKEEGAFSEKFKRAQQLESTFQHDIGENFMAEISSADAPPELRSFFSEMNLSLKAHVTEFFRLGQKEGYINKEVSIDLLIVLLTLFNELFFDPRLIAVIEEPLRRAETLNSFFFFGAKGADA